jgi:serine/arginine repetitive matrix protein 2
MYNGIGLQTARGTGTNGYVQRNLSSVRPSAKARPQYKTEEELNKQAGDIIREPNMGILEHQRKRKLEVIAN